ncbi:MAG: TIR domain-containing protein [Oscillospiraceae bacterium]|nr:TIR domain-containing protein [Oscillospiraceae bacterium]
MAVIKCKMCGGDLVLVEGQSVAECEYCGSRQTVPVADNEKKLTLFASANKLRLNCEFDRAAGIYDAIKAEFPSEAESYWGLVLCKYGIEYVDDPATGKKVPTCHRLSYDSVLDDANLDLAMEYADAVARKVYREEAKHLEKLRTGILEVSANEKPYDIFICYKETDENGDRTLDSVLAQDLYTALTAQGYRVFFSRITLQSKLGEAYEPYIFAALNSAKVMLAIATDPEYYSAVWVKNEWSRYLKICAEDKSRHLVPCYKGMDAYDMPKEFRPLQGVDLGKMGAVQDILFNMEKYIPLKKQTTTVIQEKVVVGGTGGSNKIASLLDRGNMALEDGDWAKADSFFEDVLNNDARNAQAYIGKALAQEKCRTMDALVRKRRDVYQNVRSETLYINEKSAYITEMAEQFSLSGYVEQNTIRRLYQLDLSYTSEVSGRRQQYREEEKWWAEHKQLSRAEKFAVGAVAENLQSEKKHLFTQLNDRVKKAQEADARSVAKLEAAYDAHIAEADKQAETIYNDGLARREKDYQNWLEQAKKETEPDTLKKLAVNFAGLADYKDSRNLAEHCRKRAADEQAKIDAEKERQRAAAEQKRKARQKRNKRIAVTTAACVVLVVAVTLVVTKVVIPGNAYKEAVALMENGQYGEAIVAFEALGDYKDSAEKIEKCELAILERQYNAAVALMGAGKYEEAIAAFEELSGYKDSSDMIAGSNEAMEELQLKAQYDAAAALAESGETAKAAIAFGKLKSYSDAQERSQELWAECGKETISAGYYHTVGLRNDGTVVDVGSDEDGRRDTDHWKNIIEVSAGQYHTAGLRDDGTVLAVGYNENGQCNTDHWTDIIAVSAGGWHTVGLRSNGTVVAVGMNDNGQCNVKKWTDIVAVSAGRNHTVGLRKDGTVVSVGANDYGQCNTDKWRDIIAVKAGGYHTVGLRRDGSVVAVGTSDNDRCSTEKWTDIVAVGAASSHTVALRSDGTVVAIGSNKYGQCDTENWTDIVAISTTGWYTVGLRSDGTVVATGSNKFSQCNVSDWTDIKLP